VIVLADQHGKAIAYTEKNALVIRCFEQGKRGMWRSIWAQLRQFKQVKTILVQFDFSMYGSFVTSGLILPFFGLLKTFGYKVHVVSHHVVMDVNNLKGHVGLEDTLVDRVKAQIYNSVFKSFYVALKQVTDSIIVLEDTLKHRLGHLIGESHVQVIPHAVDVDLPVISQAKARKKLGIPSQDAVVLFFGFANWFKGADLFADIFKNTTKLNGKKAHIILAGGASSTLSDKPYYQRYIAGLKKTIAESKNVTMTGYVAQEDIKAYFAAADVVVFPYRYFMCASGVLSLAFSYQKPFIVSDKLQQMFDSPDLAVALKAANLSPADLQFSLQDNSAILLTNKVLSNGRSAKMKKMGAIMRQMRSFQNNATIYESALFATEIEAKTASNTAYAFNYQK
jgi:glycosyltransferase involved in cell wall biosynthesis